MNPDLFASVDVNHLKTLNTKGLMNEHMVYVHNKLELMVAKCNPKNIKDPEDLGRDDLVQSHPNPLAEGIYKFYGSEMLQDLSLHDKVTGGQKCKSCRAVADKTWFHHVTIGKLHNALKMVKPMLASSGQRKLPMQKEKAEPLMVLPFQLPLINRKKLPMLLDL